MVGQKDEGGLRGPRKQAAPLQVIFRDLFCRLPAFAESHDVFLKLEGVKNAIGLVEDLEQRGMARPKRNRLSRIVIWKSGSVTDCTIKAQRTTRNGETNSRMAAKLIAHQTEKPNQRVQTLITRRCAIGATQHTTMATEINDKTFSTVPLDWKEVYCTNRLPSRIRQRCRSGIGLDQRGVQEDWRQLQVPPLASREQLVSALYAQPRQPYPLRRFAPAHPPACGHPQDQAPEAEQGRSFWDVEL